MTVRGSGTGTPSYTGHSSPAKDQSMQQGGIGGQNHITVICAATSLSTFETKPARQAWRRTDAARLRRDSAPPQGQANGGGDEALRPRRPDTWGVWHSY